MHHPSGRLVGGALCPGPVETSCCGSSALAGVFRAPWAKQSWFPWPRCVGAALGQRSCLPDLGSGLRIFLDMAKRKPWDGQRCRWLREDVGPCGLILAMATTPGPLTSPRTQRVGVCGPRRGHEGHRAPQNAMFPSQWFGMG